jgi:hypothetical protein
MNKFIHKPDSLAALAGCAFWMIAFAGLMAVLFGTLFGFVRGGGI